MKFNVIRRFLAILAIASLACIAANAGTITQTLQWGAGGTYVLTDWTHTLNANQFNTLGGTLVLNQIDVAFQAQTLGDAKFEHLDPTSGATITMNLATVMTASYLNGIVLSLTPTASTTDTVGAFDGVIDFGGTSGKTYTGLTATTSTSATYTTGAEMGVFTGPGTVAFNLAANGASTAGGSGNLVTQFADTARSTVTITYTYSESGTTPEPATMAMLGSALIGLGVLGRKRFAR